MELNWHMITTLNGLVVQRFGASVVQLVVLGFLEQNPVVSR